MVIDIDKSAHWLKLQSTNVARAIATQFPIINQSKMYCRHGWYSSVLMDELLTGDYNDRNCFCRFQGVNLECDGLPSLCHRVTCNSGSSAVTKRRQAVALQGR